MFAYLMTDDSYYPFDEETEGEPVPSTIRLPKSLLEKVEFIADLWNAFDVELGKGRKYKWKASSVIERLVKVGATRFGASIGGYPSTPEERKDALERAGEIARRAAESAKRTSKK